MSKTRSVTTTKSTGCKLSAEDQMRLAVLIERMEPWMIGLWRFRLMGRSRQWAVTFSHHGYYWDTPPLSSATKALERAWAMVQELDRELGPCPFATGEVPGKEVTLAQIQKLAERAEEARKA